MRLLYLLILLTFVSCLSPFSVLASPQTANRPTLIKNPIKAKPTEEKTDILKEQSTQISYPSKYDPQIDPNSLSTEESKKNKRDANNFEVTRSRRKMNYLVLMVDSGYFIQSDASKNILLLNYKRTLLSDDQADLEFGLGFSAQSISLMQLGQRWNWKNWINNEGTEHQIYLNFNVLNYIDSSQMLAALININHFKLQFVFGADNFEFFSERVGAEVGFAYGVNGVSGSASILWKF
ncbi:MAG: hypothetical protein AABY64_05155 [Bdellovibrionota bacterium]